MISLNRVLLLFVTFCILCLDSHAGGIYEGTDLHNEIQAYDRIEHGQREEGDYQQSAHALGYVQALSDIIVVQGGACPATSYRTAQTMAVVSKFLFDHPDQWNQPAYLLVGEALHDAFPCAEIKKPAKPTDK